MTPFSIRRLLGKQPPELLTVSQVTKQIQQLLEETFHSVWVVGEISNFERAHSGHCYLTLKDERAQLRAIIWSSTARRLRFELENGMEVVCSGYINVYAPRGSYQLIIQHIEPRGVGALQLAFQKLYQKLARQGLFDPQRKRPLPVLPRLIAVVTSPAGAAIRDFLQVLAKRRFGADILIFPVRVQGEGAAEEIADAIRTVNNLSVAVDCLVVTRGGGSLEDLWAFNEEVVVRAIVASRIPVISAVGHEVDVTLSDLAADVRALTPSHAAQLVSQKAEELGAELRHAGQRLRAALAATISQARSRWEAIARHSVFRRPFQRVHELAGRLDELDQRSATAIRRQLQSLRQRADDMAGRLDALSPLAVLGRGYSLTRRVSDGRLVRDASELSAGELIATRFARGEATSRVERTG